MLPFYVSDLIYMNITVPKNSQLGSKDFIFGVATAAIQIEGGADHRLESIWDRFCAIPGAIRDGSNALVACDHYNRWQEDVELIEHLGVDAYRLSISWPRVMDRSGQLSKTGVAFYVNLLDRLNAKDIKPFVTFYHWDLPQHLQDSGGWLNRETAIKFRDYVDLVSKEFGDRVYSYATLNEPFCSAYLGYEIGIHAPGITGQQYGKKAAHHLLLAHGLAIEVLAKNSPNSLNGIVLNFSPCYSRTDTPEDVEAAKLADINLNQWYIEPLLNGRYPDLLETLPDDHKPDIQEGDMALISHAIDFIGINYYTREFYQKGPSAGYEKAESPMGQKTDMGWEVFPQGLTDLLDSLNKQYELPPVYITENGAAMRDTIKNGVVDDADRVAYYQSHLQAVDNAINRGVDIRGYFAWSLLDNFEWAEGYAKRFGIVHVDYKTQKRTVKASGKVFGEFLKQRAA